MGGIKLTIYELSTFPGGATKANELAKTKAEGIVVAVVESHWLATGVTAGTYDVSAQQRLNIPVFQSQHIGGTCVVFPGDLSLCELHHGLSNFGFLVVQGLETYLNGLGFRTHFDGNDLMLHFTTDDIWRKVASHGSGWISNGYSQVVVHVSIGMDEHLVDTLCTKPCKKRPGGLGIYGITAEEIYNKVVQPIITKLYKEE